jgi:hypothetical protein
MSINYSTDESLLQLVKLCAKLHVDTDIETLKSHLPKQGEGQKHFEDFIRESCIMNTAPVIMAITTPTPWNVVDELDKYFRKFGSGLEEAGVIYV